jgi:hypothetical protein
MFKYKSLYELLKADIKKVEDRIEEINEELYMEHSILKRCKKQTTIDRYLRYIDMSRKAIEEETEYVNKLKKLIKNLI